MPLKPELGNHELSPKKLRCISFYADQTNLLNRHFTKIAKEVKKELFLPNTSLNIGVCMAGKCQ